MNRYPWMTETQTHVLDCMGIDPHADPATIIEDVAILRDHPPTDWDPAWTGDDDHAITTMRRRLQDETAEEERR